MMIVPLVNPITFNDFEKKKMTRAMIVLVSIMALSLMGCGAESSGGSGTEIVSTAESGSTIDTGSNSPEPMPTAEPISDPVPTTPEPTPTPEPVPIPPESTIAPYTVNYSNSVNLSASSDSTIVPGSTGGGSQKFVVSDSGWNGAFFTDWGAHDLSDYNTLDFWVKGASGGEALYINVSDGTNSYSTNIPAPSDGSWQNVSMEFSAMTEVDFTKWQSITFTAAGTVNTTFYINNVKFSYIAPYTGPEVTVVPWNGAQSAISLTFDDALDSQLDVAIPALNAKNMDATFFLITETAITGARKDGWKSLPLSGHELGNHSKHHYNPSADPVASYERTFDDTLAYNETVAAQADLEQAMETTVSSYAYPYTNNDPLLVKYLQDTHLSARGGAGPDGNYFMNPSYNPDWMNISCLFTGNEGTFDADYKGWIDTAMSQGAWLVFGIHGVGDIAYTSFPLDQFNLVLDYLDANRSSIWIAPFGTVSGYWRAQKIIEGLTPNATSTGTSYAWQVPGYFPNDINLKVKMKNGIGYQLVQSGQVIQPDADGNYTISFAAASLELMSN
jgi:peptidoglycan/xylan/chitin deacetylase (PgdA/CDA1 family)